LVGTGKEGEKAKRRKKASEEKRGRGGDPEGRAFFVGERQEEGRRKGENRVHPP